MLSKNGKSFRLYRYQITATTKHIQGDFINGINSVDDLTQRKNEFFANVLNSIDKFVYRRAPITHQLYTTDSTFILQLAPNRPIERTTRDLVKEEVDNWPAIIVVIDNVPNRQYIAVEMKQKAFRYTKTVVSMLETNINKYLKRYQLFAQIEPLFEKHYFWDVINKGEVDYVRFYINAPNLANLSGSLTDSLKNIIKRTNARKAHLGLFSPPEESLEISEDNKDVEGIVEYISGGGGTGHIKIKGVSALFKTDDEEKRITIDEVVFDGDFDPEIIGEAVRRAIDNVQ